jgi:hypothetical protein
MDYLGCEMKKHMLADTERQNNEQHQKRCSSDVVVILLSSLKYIDR